MSEMRGAGTFHTGDEDMRIRAVPGVPGTHSDSDYPRIIVGKNHLMRRNKQNFEDVCYPGLKTRWLIGGRLVSNEDEFSYTFERPGEYLITCKIYDNKYKLLDSGTKKVIAVMPRECNSGTLSIAVV